MVIGLSKMIFVCGISASGKSSIVGAFTATNCEYIHVKGSWLLERAGRPIRSLNASEAEPNQQVLLDVLRTEQLIQPLAILDGHITIETAGDLYVVPIWFFREAKISGIICIVNEPATIESRRREKGLSSNVSINSLQESETSWARKRAEELGIAYFQIDANDPRGFEIAVSSIGDHQQFFH
jgi:adenylate kinase